METALQPETTEVVESPKVSEDESVVAWRLDRCGRMGFTDEAAPALASDCLVDLHYLEALLTQGCSHSLAEAIVATELREVEV